MLGGRVLVVAQTDLEWPTAIIGLNDGVASLLRRFPSAIDGPIYESEGRVITGRFELVNLESAWSVAFANPDDVDTSFDLSDDWYDDEP